MGEEQVVPGLKDPKMTQCWGQSTPGLAPANNDQDSYANIPIPGKGWPGTEAALNGESQ